MTRAQLSAAFAEPALATVIKRNRADTVRIVELDGVFSVRELGDAGWQSETFTTLEHAVDAYFARCNTLARLLDLFRLTTGEAMCNV